MTAGNKAVAYIAPGKVEVRGTPYPKLEQGGQTGICLDVNPDRPGSSYGCVDMGGWVGGQAEYVLVPCADWNLLVFPDPDQALEKVRDLTMLSDIFPTGFHGAYTAGVKPGSTVHVAGAGPVGLAAAASAQLLGAAVVIVGDLDSERLAQARSFGCAGSTALLCVLRRPAAGAGRLRLPDPGPRRRAGRPDALAAAVLVGVAVPRSAGVTRDSTAVPDGTADRRADGYVAELRAGLAHLVRDRLLRSIAGMVLLTNLVDAGVSGLLLLVWARDRFGSATPVGLVGGVFGGGALLGALVPTAFGPRLPRRLTFGFAFVLAGAPRIAVLLLPVPLWVIAVVWAVCGFGAGAINPLLSAAEYERVPRDLQARVLGSLGAVAWAGIPFGALLAGLLVGATDLRTALVVGAVLYGLATLDPFIRPAWALMDRRPAGPLPPVAGARPGYLPAEPDTFVHE